MIGHFSCRTRVIGKKEKEQGLLGPRYPDLKLRCAIEDVGIFEYSAAISEIGQNRRDPGCLKNCWRYV